MRKTLTSLYQDVETAQKVVKALVDEGFSRNDVSMLVNLVSRDNDPYKGAKARYWRRGNVDAPMGVLLGLLAGVAIGAVVGALLTALPLTFSLGTMAGWGAAIGGVSGAIAGGILNTNVPRILGQNLATVEKAGATLVRVRTSDDERDKAREIMNRYEPVDMEGRLETWGEKGWESYDPASEPVR